MTQVNGEPNFDSSPRPNTSLSRSVIMHFRAYLHHDISRDRHYNAQQQETVK